MASILDVKTLWKEDVIAAWLLTCNHHDTDKPKKLLEFLAAVEVAHELRWKRDPQGGEGAIAWFDKLIKKGDL
jgi:uncharacterized membrane protein